MKSRNGGKAIIIVLLIILLILALIGGGAYIYLATDLFKTPEQLFKKYMLSNIIELAQTEIKPFDDIDRRSESELTEYSLKLGVDAQKLEMEDMQKLDINLALKTDWPNKNEEIDILINKDEEEYFKGYMALTNETFGIKIPDIYDKYLAVENRDFKKMAKTFELSEEYIEMIPDKIPSALTKEEEEKITALATKYLTKMVEQFEENAYIAEKDINVAVNKQELVTDKYTLTMSTKNLYTLLTNTITELLDDPEFLELTKDRIQTEQLDELKNKYKELLAENSVEDIEEEIVKISVYAAGGRTVKTEMKTDKGDEFNYFIINSETENLIVASTITPKSDYNKVETTTTTTMKNTYANGAGELTCESLTSYNKDDIEALQTEHDAEYADYEYGSGFDTDYSKIYKDQKTKYVINTKKSNEDTYTGTIKFEGEDLDELKEILDISFKCQFGKASITTLSKENSTVINDYTMEDYEGLITELGTNLVSTVLLKPDSLIGTIFTSFATGDSTTTEDSYYSDDYYSNNDYSSDDSYSDIDFSDDSSNDNYLYPTVTDNTEVLRGDIDTDITSALNTCLTNYKDEITYNNPEANVGDFLNIDRVQECAGTNYVLELLDGTTIKCTTNKDGTDYIYYALMNIDETYTVREVEVLTEEEYLNR